MILTVTLNPAVDHTVKVDALPASGEVVRTEDARVDPGGKGINVSKYLAQLGSETLSTGLIGGSFGQFISQELTDAAIPNDFVEISEQTRLNTTILATDGEHKINQDGPTVDPTAIDDVVRVIERHDPETIVIAGSRPPGIEPGHLDRIARAGPWETVVDVDGETLAQLEAKYALCKPNEEELAAATGMPTNTVDDSKRAARALRDHGFDTVVASLGGSGAVMVTAEESLHAPAQNVDVVDTVGAGDALLAGVLAELANGKSPVAALRMGVGVAARVVGVAGTDVPSFADLQADVEQVQVSAQQ